MSDSLDWHGFHHRLVRVGELGFVIDLSTMPLSEQAERELAPSFANAFDEMREIEAGAIGNPDEQRRVGHYWLRSPERAPEPEWRAAIVETRERIQAFAARVHAGEIAPPEGDRFSEVLHIGIGGSALGPQLAVEALSRADDPVRFTWLDNTDPNGFDAAFERLAGRLARTLIVVVSKSGGTPETRNGLEHACARLRALGLEPGPQLVAVTAEGSALERRSHEEGWLERFPMWDWVGGRTSLSSAVGLVPMSLAGHDVDAFLAGAGEMDAATRVADLTLNPAARLALAWHVATSGRGLRDMVIIPYRDRLALLARYLQQLVMESLGKRFDRDGRLVRQGITVYGNKGSTDQHAYIQQLRDGVDNYFVTLIGVLDDGAAAAPLEVEPGITSGDYLLGFLLGTRRALAEDGRQVITLMLPRLDARALGGLVALYERAVGLYASLVRINAYHQPGVEAGKQAAAGVLRLQRALVEAISASTGEALSAQSWAERIGEPQHAVEALWVLEHLAFDERAGIVREGVPGDPAARYRAAD
ncbi:MAG: glucose-6-phosphate isomerase [Acidobacteriota bacterium]|nr:MAG: glucose-6-phosphate isomerase [Acidobacteriota bacterium]